MSSFKESQIEQNIRELNEVVLDEEHQEYEYYQDSMHDESNYRAEASCIFEVQSFLQKIQKEVQEKMSIFNVSFDWALMIYDRADFNPDKLSDLLDEDQTWKQTIKYNEDYSLVLTNGKCMKCFQTTNLLNNSCGHLCCTKCWENHLRINYLIRINLKLFPLCLKEQCNHYVNYEIIAYIKHKSSSLRKLYEYALISKYCRTNSSIKFCPNLSCGKIIDRSLCKDENINCSCGLQLCLSCGEQSHSPLQCHDLEAWNRLVLFENEQKSFIECFNCQTLLSVEGDSKILQCVCGQTICWRCQNAWTIQCTYRTCNVKNFKVLASAIEIDNHGKDLSHKSYQEAKEFFDQLGQSIKRLKGYSVINQKQQLLSISVLQIDAQILDQMRKFILNAWQIVRRCCVYVFFQRKHADDLKKMMDLLNMAAVRADNYLCGSLLIAYQAQKQRASKDPVYRKIFEKQKKSKQQEIKSEFSIKKKNFVHLMNEGNQIIELIKKRKISEAYQNVNLLNKVHELGMNRRTNAKS